MSSSFVLPESFLEEVRKSRLSYLAKDGSMRVLPFVGGGSVDAGIEGEGETESASGEGSEGKSEEPDKEEQDDSEDDEGNGLPENVKEIIRKNRAATRAAERRLQAATKQAEAAQRKVKEYEDRDKTELEKLTERAETAEQRLAEVMQQNKAMALRSAFLAESGIDWVDPEDAVEMAMSKYGLSEVEVNDAGKADQAAVKSIIKTLSKDKPYLVNKEDSKQGPSGGAFNGSKGGKPAADKAGLAQKYPALRGRQKS